MMEAAIAIAARPVPERTCVGCGRRRGQGEMVRFSSSLAGLRVHLERGEGRGAYCCPDIGCLERAVKRKALQKALGGDLGPLSVQQLREAIDQAILEKVRRLLGLARRAKRLVAGSRGVTQALTGGRVRLVLLSQDMFPQVGKQFQEEAARRGVPVTTVFSRKDLDTALGGPSREVVGLLDDGFAEGILRALRYWIPGRTGERLPEQEQEWQTGGGRRG